MKILGISDTHIGAGYEHRADALADTQAVLDQAADLAIERGCDLFAHAGDLFHRTKPSPPELHVAKRFFDRLAAAGIPGVLLHGNGSHSAAVGQASAEELFASPWLRVSRRPEAFMYPGVTVCTLPAVSLAQLGAQAGSSEGLAEQAVGLLLRAARDLRAEADQPAVLLGHWGVSGNSLPTGLPVEQLSEPVLPLEELAAIGFDANLFGHIHRAAILWNPSVISLGSPMCMDFGEAGLTHGCWILDLDTTGTLHAPPEFVPLTDRRFVTVDVDLTPDSLVKGAVSHAREEGPCSPTPEKVRPTAVAPGMRAPDPESNRERSGGEAATSADIGSRNPTSSPLAEPTEWFADPFPAADAIEVSADGAIRGLQAYWNPDETDHIAAAIAECFPLQDAVVRVRYRASEEQHRRVDHAALERLIQDAGAHKLYGGIQWEPVREQRARAEGLDESLGPMAALDLWLEAQSVNGAEGAGLRALLGEWLEAEA